MRERFQSIVERGRLLTGPYGSHKRDRFGWFEVGAFRLMVSDGSPEMPWEHVSVSLASRIPTWEEMSLVKSWFWGEEEAVMQLHPPEADYINQHPNCLHLWKPWPQAGAIPLPPTSAVGLRG